MPFKFEFERCEDGASTDAKVRKAIKDAMRELSHKLKSMGETEVHVTGEFDLKC